MTVVVNHKSAGWLCLCGFSATNILIQFILILTCDICVLESEEKWKWEDPLAGISHRDLGWTYPLSVWFKGLHIQVTYPTLKQQKPEEQQHRSDSS